MSRPAPSGVPPLCAGAECKKGGWGGRGFVQGPQSPPPFPGSVGYGLAYAVLCCERLSHEGQCSPHFIRRATAHRSSVAARWRYRGLPEHEFLSARSPDPRRPPPPPTPGVVKQDKSSGGSVDTTKTRSDPQRVRMSSGEGPIGTAKGKQTNTMAPCPPPLQQF